MSSANFASKIFVLASSSVDGREEGEKEEEKSRVVILYEWVSFWRCVIFGA